MKKNIRIEVDIEKCKGCLFCVDACPQKILKASKKVNKKGVQYVVITDPDKCTGCGLCFIMCPDNAITIKSE